MKDTGNMCCNVTGQLPQGTPKIKGEDIFSFDFMTYEFTQPVYWKIGHSPSVTFRVYEVLRYDIFLYK